MKKLLFLILAGACLIFASNAMAVISGSVHDFTESGGGPVSITGEDQLCVFCHTPHGATTTDAPLWNHTETSASFQAYQSGSLTATVGSPNGVSKLCLSCHDGTVGIDAYGTQTGVPTMITNDRGALIGTDLRNDHPVSFTYNTQLSTDDGALFDPSTKTTALGGTIEEDLLYGTAGSKTMECASCHDVHNGAVADAAGNLLRISNAGSGLCITCHNK